MIPDTKHWSDLSTNEWNRLSSLSTKYEGSFKTEFIRSATKKASALSSINELILDLVSAVGISTANTYGIIFNPSSPIYKQTADRLLSHYEKAATDEKAKGAVKAILPPHVSFNDRRKRLDVFGVDPKSAVRIERMWQRGEPEYNILQERYHAISQRGNLIALTEVNRIINATIESLWLDNLGVRKAEEDVWFAGEGIPNNVTNMARLPKRAKKEIITRRDDAVCNYCFPLDGLTAAIGQEFDTDYGLFLHPPFHPRCRCYLIINTKGR